MHGLEWSGVVPPGYNETDENPFLDKDALFDKTSVLDVKSRTESGMLIDVEIQLWGRYHTTFHLREDVTGVLLTDLLEIHFVELRKLREQAVGMERRLVRWIRRSEGVRLMHGQAGRRSEGWHHLSPDRVIQLLNTNEQSGLSAEEAKRRFRLYGPNRLPVASEKPWWKEIAEEVTEPMMLLLLAVGAAYSLLGELQDAITIFVILVSVLAIEMWNEGRAKKAIRSLTKLNTAVAPVIRDGTYRLIPASELVPGDIVLLRPGQRVPADLRLLEAAHLRMDESGLTGESVPIPKEANVILPEETELAGRRNLAFSGSLVANGKGKGVVVHTGMATEIGKTAGLVKEAREPRTPLQIHMRELARWMVWTALGFSASVAFLGWIRGMDGREALLTGLSLAFATIPEELPVLIAIVLGIGAYRLARHNAVLRRLRTAEAVGHITVVATDKTGTLTENRMRVAKWFVSDQWLAGEELRRSAWGDWAVRIGVLANDAYGIGTSGGGKEFEGDPTDVAFLNLAVEMGYDVSAIRKEFKILEEYPLDHAKKRISVLVRKGDSRLVLSKGAPEQLLLLADRAVSQGRIVPMDEALRNEMQRRADRLASEGYRVLGLAFKEEPASDFSDINREEAESCLVFVGLAAFLDLPRLDAAEAVRELQRAGVRVVMMTGDHPETARTIAGMVGIPASDILLGRQIENMTEDELRRRVREVSVFARITPEQKLRIVRALQELGERVAVTGDGVNDGPALKEAAVGIAMGKTGTDVAKEAADMVLADDRFSTIVVAVREGRTLFDNLFKAVRYYLAAKVALIASTLFAGLAGVALPFSPVQMIVLEFFMDLGASTSFTAERPERDVMKCPPRRAGHPFMDRTMVAGIFSGGGSLAAAVIAAHLWSLQAGAGARHAQTVAFATLMIGHVMLAFVMRSLREPVIHLGLFSNKAMWIWAMSAAGFLVAAVGVPGLREALHLTPVRPQEWFVAIASAVLAPVWMEVGKWVYWKKRLKPS